jgi:uncharacterized membrane protein YhiD involved in acid resistance
MQDSRFGQLAGPAMLGGEEDVYLLGVALAIGLLIGLERGWKERDAQEGHRIAGVRTYGLIGLLGGVLALLTGHVGALALGLGFIGVAGTLTGLYRNQGPSWG